MLAITVNTSADTVVADSFTSLREAIDQANSSPGADVINFDTTVFNGEADDVIRLASQLPTITQDLTIDASGTTEVVISGDVLGDDTLLTGTKLTDLSTTASTELDDNVRLLNISAGSTTLNGLTLTGGRTSAFGEHGGGIRSTSADGLTFINSMVAGNSTSSTVSYGGGIFSQGGVTLTGSTVSGNSTARNGGKGGAVFAVGNVTLTDSTVSGNSTAGDNANGGGIFSRGEVTLTGSTVSGNSTAGRVSQGGGIHSVGNATLTNSTLSGNSTAGNSAVGGGMLTNGSAMVNNSTVTGNSATGVGANGGGVYGVKRAYLSNSIVAGNTTNADGPDILTNGGITAEHSLIGNNGGLFPSEAQTPDSNGNLIGGPTGGTINPMLGSLADNGGSTQTHALLPGSPAINAGNPNFDPTTFTPPLANDQRGFPYSRAFDGRLDMGAVEALSTVLLVDLATDENDGDYSTGDLSLREAIQLGNQSDSGVLIHFDVDVFNGEAADVIRLNSQLPTIVTNMTITAMGTTEVVISGDKMGDDTLVTGTKLTDLSATAETGLDDNVRLFDISSGSTTLDDLTLTGGRIFTSQDGGGAIRSFSSGMLTIVNSTVSGNSTAANQSYGGGVFSVGPLTLTSSTISGNSTIGMRSGGGGIFSAGELTLTASTVSGNSTTGGNSDGGGIYGRGNVNVAGSTVDGNFTTNTNADGGGIFSDGTVTVTNSTVSRNFTRGSDSWGGGIHSNTGVNLVASTVNGNSTTGEASFGGGISSLADVMLNNSTVSGNATAGIGSTGGSVYAVGSVTLFSSTVNGNSASAEGGGIFSRSGNVNVTNSIVAGNTSDSAGPDLFSFTPSVTASHSLIGSNQGSGLTESQTPDSNGNLVGAPGNLIDPILGPLTDNGGATRTRKLLPNSPAVNAGDPNAVAGQNGVPLFDQRGTGFERIIDGRLDIGAVEINAVKLLSFTRQNPTSPVTAADTLVFRATFDEEVFNVDSGDFIVDGGTTAVVSNVAVVDGETYDITVSGGDLATYSGAVGLDLASANNIVNAIGNALPSGEPAIDETYALDNAGPLLSFTRHNPVSQFTDADTLVFRATFNEDVVEVDVSDFTVNGGSTAGITDVSAINARTYNITVSGGDLANFNGTVGLDVASGNNIADLLGNALPAGEPATDQTYALNNLGSVVVSTLADAVDSDFSVGQLSLREAILFANAVSSVTTITFDSTLLSGGTIHIASQLPTITSDLTINGLGASLLTIDAGNGADNVFATGDGYRIFEINDSDFTSAPKNVEISGLTLTGGDVSGASDNGGAILSVENLTIRDTVLAGNASTDDGGAVAISGGAFSIINSTLSGNKASDAGGGFTAAGATTNVDNSTIANNVARRGGGLTTGGFGTLNMTNSTVSGNTVTEAGGGMTGFSGSVNLAFSTVTGNTAGTSGAALYGGSPLDSNAVFTINSSIIAGDVSSRAPVTGSYNLFSQTVAIAGVGNMQDTNPMLGPLVDNGGPTSTHKLLVGSPAINAGDPNAVAGQNGVPLFDQRGSGFDRVLGGRIDIGAFEFLPTNPTPGDYNGDLLVNAADYTVWRDSIGSSGLKPFSGADGDGDGAVTTADYPVWQGNHGAAYTLPTPDEPTPTPLIDPAAVLTEASASSDSAETESSKAAEAAFIRFSIEAASTDQPPRVVASSLAAPGRNDDLLLLALDMRVDEGKGDLLDEPALDEAFSIEEEEQGSAPLIAISLSDL